MKPSLLYENLLYSYTISEHHLRPAAESWHELHAMKGACSTDEPDWFQNLLRGKRRFMWGDVEHVHTRFSLSEN